MYATAWAEASSGGIVERVAAAWASALATSSSRQTRPQSALGDTGGVDLGGEVLFGDDDLVLQTPEAQVFRAHFPHQGDQHVPAVLHRGLQIGVGGLDVAAGAAEDVELPCGVQTRLE